MAVYMVSYDLKTPGQNYEDVIAKIKSYPDHIKVLYSAFCVKTTHNSKQVYDHIKPALDKNDNIIVIQVTRDYNGWLPKNIWEWLNARL